MISDGTHGFGNFGDYTTKHHDTNHHKNVRPIYLHKKDSPTEFPRELKPSDMRGCVGNKSGGYKRGHHMPVIPRDRYLGRDRLTHGTKLTRGHEITVPSQ